MFISDIKHQIEAVRGAGGWIGGMGGVVGRRLAVSELGVRGGSRDGRRLEGRAGVAKKKK